VGVVVSSCGGGCDRVRLTVAEWRSRGGQAAADMADVRSLQAEQEARGGPVVGSRKRTSTQRMNL
jgi:hypothetical protein